jgi:hypothetical protein
MIPISRFNQKIEMIRALEAKIAEKDTTLASIRTEAQRSQQKASEDAALLRAGIHDAEDMELVRWRYERVPASERGDFVDFVSAKAKEDRYLSKLFGGTAAPPAPAPPTPPPTQAPAPTAPTSAGTQPAPSAGGQRTVKWFNGLSEAEKNKIPHSERIRGLAGEWPMG